MMKNIFTVFVFVVLSPSLLFADVDQGGELHPLVITSLPATQLLAQSLTDGTDITVELVVPANYAMGAQENYFKKNANFLEKSAVAKACVTLASAWKGDSLYPFARRNNISIIEIDAAAPIDRRQAGVVLLNGLQSGEIDPYIWRSPANLSRMVGIVASDLQRLFPRYEQAIHDNLLRFQRELFQLRTRFEILFGEKDMGEIVALTDDFLYLTSEFGVEVGRYFLKEEIDWSSAEYSEFTAYLKEMEVKTVLCRRVPGEKLAAAIADGGAAAVVFSPLATLTKSPVPQPATIFLQFFARNLNALSAALGK